MKKGKSPKNSLSFEIPGIGNFELVEMAEMACCGGACNKATKSGLNSTNGASIHFCGQKQCEAGALGKFKRLINEKLRAHRASLSWQAHAML